MIHSGPDVVDLVVVDGSDVVSFAVVMVVDEADLAGVSVKGGEAYVVSAVEVAAVEVIGQRKMRFDVEAMRTSSPWTVAITAQCGKATVTAPSVTVPAR